MTELMRNCKKLPCIVWFPELLTQNGSWSVYQHIEIQNLLQNSELKFLVLNSWFVLFRAQSQNSVALPERFCLFAYFVILFAL